MFRTDDEIGSYIFRDVWGSMQAKSQQRTLRAEQQAIQNVKVVLTVKWSNPLDFHVVPTVEAVARVNAAGYFMLTANSDIYKMEPNGGITLRKKAGFNNIFACRSARCDSGKLISAGFAWKKSRNRREYDSIGYWPDNHRRPAKSYNLWQAWGIHPAPGNWSPIYDYIIDVLAAGDINTANYILDFCAHIVQRPWEKPRVALVFKGRNGTGKSLLAELLAAIIGRPNTFITTSGFIGPNGRTMFEKFNWNLADKLLVGVGDPQFAGKREVKKLKQLLIGDEIEVKQKFGRRISMKSLHRIIITSTRDLVIAALDDERRFFFMCDVSDKRRWDDAYFDPLWKAVRGENNALLAAFFDALLARDIKNWNPQQAARKANGVDLARQKLQTLEPPLQWLLEKVQAATSDGAPNRTDMTTGTWALKQERGAMLRQYREWAKTTQVRQAIDFTGAQVFWRSIKRLLNEEVFPGKRLFRRTGAARYVLMPTRQEMRKGFNRMLGGKVVGEHS